MFRYGKPLAIGAAGLLVILLAVWQHPPVCIAENGAASTVQPQRMPASSLPADAIPENTPPSSTAPPMTDIHDIKGPVSFGIDRSIFIYLLCALIGLALIGLLIYAVLRFRRKTQTIEERVPTLPPDQTALNALEILKAADSRDARAFYFELSQIFRGYVQQRFAIDALEKTTEELLPEIKGLKLVPALLSGTREFFTSGDPVKFAGVSVDNPQMEAHLTFVESFINKTKGVEEETQGKESNG